MQSENKFNKIIVVESLAENELHSAWRLYDDINILKVKLKYLDTEIIEAKDANDLLEALKRIETEAKFKKHFPIIHIEAHGSKYGLQFVKESIPWDSLRQAFVSINIACRNNLLVTLAACEGVYLTKIVRSAEPCPFWGLIAPTTKISAGQLEISFQSFYQQLLTDRSGDKALEKLDESLLSKSVNFAFIHCINLYKIAHQNYVQRFCHGKPLKRRIENLVTRAKKSNLINHMNVNEIRQKIKYDLKHNEREHFDRYKEIFFMSDLFPENISRFDIKYEEVVSSHKC